MKWLVIGIIMLCVSLLFMLVTSIISPLQKFSVWSDWIKQNKIPKNCIVGNTLDVSTCIPTAQFAYYLYGNNLEYGIAKLFLPVATTFDADWKVQYVTSIMRAYAKGIVPGGFLTPYNLCCSIVPRPSIDKFYGECVYPTGGTAWHGAKVPAGYSKKTRGNSHWDDKSLPNSFPGQTLNIKNKDDKANWQNTILNWRTFIATVWGVYYDTASNKLVASVGCPDGQEYGGWGAKSNFLWQLYQIPYNSWMLVAFLSGQATQTAGAPIWYPTAMNPLLGIQIQQTQGGGWVGFIREFSPTTVMKAATINQYVYATVAPVAQTNAQGNKPKQCSVGGVISAGVGAGVGAAGVGAMIGGSMGTAATAVAEAAAGPVGWFALVGFLVVGGIMAGLNASQQGCGSKDSNDPNDTQMVLADDPTPTLCPSCPAPVKPSSEVSITSIDHKYYNI